MMTRRVRAKKYDNEQIKALTFHVIVQQRELTSLKNLIVRKDDNMFAQNLKVLS